MTGPSVALGTFSPGQAELQDCSGGYLVWSSTGYCNPSGPKLGRLDPLALPGMWAGSEGILLAVS